MQIRIRKKILFKKVPIMVLSKWSAGSELEVGAGGGTGGAHYDG